MKREELDVLLAAVDELRKLVATRAEIERLTRDLTSEVQRSEKLNVTLGEARSCIAGLINERDRARRERDEARATAARFERGLNLIVQGATLYGTGWCIAQAIGHRDDLDFDEFPETGKPVVD